MDFYQASGHAIPLDLSSSQALQVTVASVYVHDDDGAPHAKATVPTGVIASCNTPEGA